MPLYTAAELKEIVGGGVHPGIPDLCDALTSSLTYTGWNGGNVLVINGSYLWTDATGDLRIKASAPTSDTDGALVSSQS